MKFCSQCRLRLPEENFPLKSKTPRILYSWCKVCTANRTRKLREQNPEYALACKLAAKRADIARRERALSLLGNCCKHCGITDKRVLQIDHINGDGYKDGPRGSRKAERLVTKDPSRFQLLCANCHMIKTRDNKDFFHACNRNKLSTNTQKGEQTK